MTILRNNFDGGTDGVSLTVANSDPGGDAFDGIFKTGTGIVKFAASAPLDRATAEYVCRIASTNPTGNGVFYWVAAMGAQSQIWVRMYVRFEVAPTTGTGGHPAFLAIGDTGDVAMVSLGVVNDTNEVFVLNGNQLSMLTTTGTITAGRWFRIEARFQFSATTGNGEVRWYDEADAALEDYTEELAFTNWNLQGPQSNTYYFGYLGAAVDLEDLYLSNVELNNEDWAGPAPFRPGKGVPGVLSTPIAVHSNTW